MKLNQYDIGYSLIHRFEISLRSFIEDFLEKNFIFPDWHKALPQEVIINYKERTEATIDKDTLVIEVLEEADLRHLCEILLNKTNFNLLNININDKSLIENLFIKINKHRQIIAHSKSTFSPLDLSSLRNDIKQLNDLLLKEKTLTKLIQEISNGDVSNCIVIPQCFFYETSMHENRQVLRNNLPVNDYDYDGGFIGRKEEIKALEKLLGGKLYRHITIIGAGGVGKTALAQEYCSLQISNTSDYECIVWVSAKEEFLSLTGIEQITPELKSFEDLLDAILSVYGYQFEVLQDKIDYVNLIIETSSKPILLVIDNLETITDDKIITFIKEIPPPHKVLITSRLGLGEIEKLHHLKELKDNDAVRLFRIIAKEKSQQELASLPDDAILNITKKVSNYPLAIKWLIGQLTLGRDINLVIGDINSSDGDIALFCFKNIFNESLNDIEKDVLYAIASLDIPVSLGMICHITDFEQKSIEQAIIKLIRASLIVSRTLDKIETRYELIPLTRNFIYSKLKQTDSKCSNYKRRVLDIQNLTTEAIDAQNQYKYSLTAMGAETEEEKIALMKCMLAYQHSESGEYTKAVEILKKASEIAPSFSSVYKIWASVESKEGYYSNANEQMKKATHLSPSDHRLWLHWGNLAKDHNNLNDAILFYRKALDIDKDDPHVLGALGEAFKRNREFEKSITVLSKSIEISNKKGNSKHLKISSTSIADTLRRWAEQLNNTGDLENAKRKLDLAKVYIEQAKALGNDYKTTITYGEIIMELAANVYYKQNYEQAISYYMEALKQLPKTKNKYKKIFFLIYFRLAKSYLEIGNTDCYLENIKMCKKYASDNKSRTQLKTLTECSFQEGMITVFFDKDKYGFICPDETEESIFFHISSFNVFLNEQMINNLKGKKVMFNLVQSEDKSKAINISFIN